MFVIEADRLYKIIRYVSHLCKFIAEALIFSLDVFALKPTEYY